MRTRAFVCSPNATFLLIMLSTGVFATPVQAQETQPVAAGQLIRFDTVATPVGARPAVVGKFLSADTTWMYVDPNGPERRLMVSRASVHRLEVRIGRSGAETGAVAGFLVGAATGVAGVLAYCSDEDCDTAGRASLMFGGAFGAAGALLGALVGVGIRPHGRWAPAHMPFAP